MAIVTDEIIERAAQQAWNTLETGDFYDQPKYIQDRYFIIANEAINAFLDSSIGSTIFVKPVKDDFSKKGSDQ